MSKNESKEKILWLDSDRIMFLTMNPLEKLNRERNPASENI